jgi:L-alanine-DL-glutamate epimerase-like enolase superfamily enzyme
MFQFTIEATCDRVRKAMDEGGIGLARVDMTRCGLTQSMKIADDAASKGVMVANQSFTTDINTAASLHFLAAVPNALVLEYCVESSEISRRLAKLPFKQVDGYMHVPDEPGLGGIVTIERVERPRPSSIGQGCNVGGGDAMIFFIGACSRGAAPLFCPFFM